MPLHIGRKAASELAKDIDERQNKYLSTTAVIFEAKSVLKSLSEW
jgi:hypothetical protein